MIARARPPLAIAGMMPPDLAGSASVGVVSGS